MIPEAAVEAAAKAVFLTGYPEGCGVSWDPNNPAAQAIMRDIRVALEAAAPHMLAEAWEEGRDAEFQRSVMKRQTDPNPYRPTP